MDKKKLPQLITICLANSVIYTLPYIQSTYYDSMKAAYGFSHIQMGNLVGVYGLCNLLAYFLGGIAADSFDTKKLFAFSLCITGVTGLYSATYPSYGAMLTLSVIWSVSTILTFWPAMIKAIKSLADDAHQGWIFGIKETMVCLMTLAVSMAGLAVFNLGGHNVGTLIAFYSLCHIAIGILVLIFMPSTKVTSAPALKSLVSGVGEVLKIKGVWLIGSVIFFGTIIAIIFGRFTPFLTTVCSLSASSVAFITIIATNGFANIGSFSGGKLIDRVGSPAKFLSMGMLLCAIFALAFVLIPWSSETVFLCTGANIVFRIINGGLRTAYFATMSQVDIPQHLIGTASGIISIIGYLPDAFAYSVFGAVLEHFPTITAYKIIFSSLVLFCVLGSLCAMALHRYSKKFKNL